LKAHFSHPTDNLFPCLRATFVLFILAEVLLPNKKIYPQAIFIASIDIIANAFHEREMLAGQQGRSKPGASLMLSVRCKRIIIKETITG
jgi:hypothetical protein